MYAWPLGAAVLLMAVLLGLQLRDRVI